MRVIIETQHLHSFQTKNFLLLDEVVSFSEITQLNQGIHDVVGSRFKQLPLPHTHVPRLNDLWREHSFLEKFVKKKMLPHIIAQLTEHSRVNLAYDLVFGHPQKLLPKEKNSLKSPLFPQLNAIARLGSCQEILGACLISADPHLSTVVHVNIGNDATTLQNGQALFLSPKAVLDLDLLNIQTLSYLIVWGKSPLMYSHNPKDPYTSFLRTMNYDYGDRLNEKTHPLILI